MTAHTVFAIFLHDGHAGAALMQLVEEGASDFIPRQLRAPRMQPTVGN
jgi:hypothetical protein